jgi:replicative DNA helicase
MSNLWETTDLQRSFLKLLISNKIYLTRYISSTNEEWFDTPERSFILSIIKEKFKKSKSVITNEIFSHEVEKKFSDDGVDYITEWEIIKKFEPIDTGEALVDLLSKAVMGDKVTEVMNKVVALVESGDVQEAARVMCSEGVSLSVDKTHDVPIANIRDIDARKKLLIDKRESPDKYAGIKTGMPSIDNFIGGLFPAELTLIVAVTGVGKSTMLKALAHGVMMRGKNCLYVTNEENLLQVLNKFDALFTNRSYHDFKVGNLEDEEISKWEKLMTEEVKQNGCGEIFVKELAAHTTAFDIEQAVVELNQHGHRIDAIFIDYMDQMKPTVQAWSEYDEQSKVSVDCKNLAIQFTVPVVTATQAATRMEERQERGKKYGKMDVYGSKRKVHASNVVMCVSHVGHYESKDKSKPRDRKWDITITKNRDGAPFSFKARHKVLPGRVVEVDEKGDPKKSAYKALTEDQVDAILGDMESAKAEGSEAEYEGEEVQGSNGDI